MIKPKPWQRVSGSSNSSELLNNLSRQSSGLESNPVDPETANKMAEQNEIAAQSTTATVTPGTTTAAAGGLNSDYGSSLGGGLGGYGGYGSSFGGMGGLGGLGGGMYGGLGGMGMGMYGGGLGMMGMDQNSSFFQSIQFMQSMSFVIQSMCQVVKMLETNTEGIIGLWGAIVNIVKKSKDWFVSQGVSIKDWIFKMVFKVLTYTKLVKSEEQMMDDTERKYNDMELSDDDKMELLRLKKKRKVYQFMMKASLVLILGCLVYFYKTGRFLKQTIEVQIPSATTAATGALTGGAGADPFSDAFNTLSK